MAPLMGSVCAESISFQSISIVQLNKCIHDNWRIESIIQIGSVPGWKATSESRGVEITISRTPYSNELHQTKWGALEVHVPSIDLWIMPSDFEAEYIPRSDITFSKGAIITPKYKFQVADVGMLIVNDFTAVGSWYVFYVDKSFKDWKTPISDIVEVFENTPDPASPPPDEIPEESGKE